MTTLQRYQMFIDGKWVDAADGRTFTSLNPSTGDDWSEIPEATAADVNRAVEAAHRAFTQGEWATALPTARGRKIGLPKHRTRHRHSRDLATRIHHKHLPAGHHRRGRDPCALRISRTDADTPDLLRQFRFLNHFKTKPFEEALLVS
mgnify:CR=1 FL=1